VDEGRFEYVWVSASEGSRWRDMVTKFTDKIHQLGPMPRMAEAARTLCKLEGMLGVSSAQPDMWRADAASPAPRHDALLNMDDFRLDASKLDEAKEVMDGE